MGVSVGIAGGDAAASKGDARGEDGIAGRPSPAQLSLDALPSAAAKVLHL